MSGPGSRAPGRPATEREIANLSAARAGQSHAASWTGERISLLRTLYDEGHSYTEIARRMGITRNAAVGMAHRLCLPSRQSPINRSADPAHVKRAD